MNIEEFREYCLSKKGVTESLPFGPDTLVFKVLEKIFALASLEYKPFRVNLKCEPQRAEQLREEYSEIIPGYHMNKLHWNSVYMESPNIPLALKKELIDHSYDLVVQKLPKKQREQLFSD